MAESIAQRDASDIIEPSSAGLYPLGRLEEFTTQTLIANDYPIEGLSSKPVQRKEFANANLIVNLSGMRLDRVLYDWNAHSGASKTGPRLENWDVADPYGEDPVTYQRILEDIEFRVRRLAERLRAEKRSAEV
jgi:protein-tyrosine-phosphatase